MQLRAASRMIFKDGGWDAAFGVSLLAVVFGAAVLMVVVVQRTTDSPAAVPSPDDRATTSTVPLSAQRSGAIIEPQPTVPGATPVAPVTAFGRSLTLVEDRGLSDRITAVLGDNAAHFSVVVIRPSDGRAALIDPDRVFYAASTFKLAILYEAGLRLSRGELGLGDRLFLSQEDIAEDLGTLQYMTLDDEGAIAVVAALEAMVALSDNAIAVALLHVFTGASIDGTLHRLGIGTMSVNTVELPTTAGDLARIMDPILAGEGLDAATHGLLMGMLSRQHTRDGIPRGLPDDMSSGNKTGTWDGVTHDVAWVQAPSGAYVLAVLSDTDRDWTTIAAVSTAVYEALESRP